jgi:hypothetical protein
MTGGERYHQVRGTFALSHLFIYGLVCDIIRSAERVTSSRMITKRLKRRGRNSPLLFCAHFLLFIWNDWGKPRKSQSLWSVALRHLNWALLGYMSEITPFNWSITVTSPTPMFYTATSVGTATDVTSTQLAPRSHDWFVNRGAPVRYTA